MREPYLLVGFQEIVATAIASDAVRWRPHTSRAPSVKVRKHVKQKSSYAIACSWACEYATAGAAYTGRDPVRLRLGGGD